MANNSNNDNKAFIECYICLEAPKLPVATPCGHIFCWGCIQTWIRGQAELQCPVCKNGLDVTKLVSLYTSNSQGERLEDTRPKTERVQPVRNENRPGFLSGVANSFGYFGFTANQEDLPLPNENDVKANRLALIMLIIGIILVYIVFRGE